MNRIKHFKTKMSEEIVLAYLEMEKNGTKDNLVWEGFFDRFPELEANRSNENDFDLDIFAFLAAMTEISMETDSNYQRVGKKFLVIDQDQITVHLIREYLNTEYNTVIATWEENKIFNILETNKIDIVLLEVFIPGLDGFKLIKKIKSQFPGIPVIVQTVFAFIQEKEMCVESGCNDYISKPYLKDDFIKVIDHWLKKLPKGNPESNNQIFIKVCS